jgi:cbb3-type cytochrome c oxidase subunit III
MKRRLSGEELAGLLMLAILAFAIGLGAIGFYVGRSTKSTHSTAATTPSTTTTVAPVDPTIAAGAHTFVQFACAQCHGLDGAGGVSPDVPSLRTAATTLTPEALRTIINHGLGSSANRTKPYMPVWGAVISTQQVNDLVAYIRAGLPAVPDATPVVVPQGQGQVVAGSALYVRYGCINCHGPNGLGGVPNPLSADKTIPPLSGADFRNQFNTDAKIIDVIRAGSVIGRAPIVSMPHWGGILSAQQLQDLTEYIKTLKS